MSASNLTLSELMDRALGYSNTNQSDSHYGGLTTSWLNDALARMVSFAEPIEATTTITATSGVRAYPLPDNLIRIKQVNFNGLTLTPRQLITQDFFDQGTTTYPDRYAIWNNQILLGPLPPANAYPIDIYYFREPTPMSAAGDTPEVPNRFRPYLADYAAANIFLADGALSDAQVLMSRFNQACLELSDWQRNRFRETRTIVDTAGYF